MEHKKKKTKLYFFTAEYPFFSGIGEPFIENEIPYLSDGFDEVVVLPYGKVGVCHELPEKVRLELLSFNSKFHFTDTFLIIKILFYEFIHMRNRLFFLKKIRTLVAILKNSIYVSRSIEKLISFNRGDTNTETIYYSYWMDEWALALAILKDEGKINSFVFRCGGFDIWDERHEGNYLPFRFYIYNKTSGIYPNSKMGEKYLKKINHFSDKIKCLYWGTIDKGLNPFDEKEITSIVSCSSMIPLKRVNIIVSLLKHINLPLKWVHFGDGPLKEELLEQIKTLPENIKVELKGNVNNSIIIDYYTKNSVTCFINTSSTESLPVSIQEAISFGIPVIATNVGGVSEIVNDQTGLLIAKDFDEKEVASVVRRMIFDQFTNSEYRKTIRDFWLENFSAKKNYTEFVKVLTTKAYDKV